MRRLLQLGVGIITGNLTELTGFENAIEFDRSGNHGIAVILLDEH